MVHAFIMVEADAGRAEGMLSAIEGLERVVTAHIVAGDYDVIVEVDAPEVYDVLETVSSGIQTLEGVADTRTYIAMD